MTSTDVERASDTTIEAIDDQLDPAERRHLAALWKQANRLAGSGLVPDALAGKPDAVLAVILFGEQYGLAPAHSVAQLWIIKGRIVPSSQVLAGVAMRAGHEVRIEESSSERCTVAIRRRGTDFWQRATWTIEDATRAKLADKDLWKTYTADMLAHATMRRAVKRICPDVLLGIDDGGDDGRAITDVLHRVTADDLAADEKVVDVALDDHPEEDIVDAELVERPTPDGGDETEPDPEAAKADRDRAQRGLMAQATKAFPKDPGLNAAQQKAKQTAQRHALAYAVLGEHKSANVMTLDELTKVTYWLKDVEEGRVTVSHRDGAWVVGFNGEEVIVPAEPAAA
jgi:hypothetical protein